MTRTIVTYREYAALPDDGRRYEVFDGEIFVMPAPGSRHQRTSRNLFVILHRHTADRGLGEVLFAPLDVILSDTTIVQPDLVFLDRTRLSAISARGVEGPPTLVVGILSPASMVTDRVTKPQLYARYGVPYMWLVDSEARSVEAFVLGAEGYTLVARASGSTPVGLPPFPELGLIPDLLWP